MPLSGVDCYPARSTEIIGERERNKDIGMGISDASIDIDIHGSSWEAPWSGGLFSCGFVEK